MAYRNQCQDGDLQCDRLRRFSNPDHRYEGDPLGVAGDRPSPSIDGPSDARRTINATGGLVASFRSRACTDLTVSPKTRFDPTGGGTIQFAVSTTPGCLCEAESEADFLSITSGTLDSGPRAVTVEVAPGEERSGTLTIAGQTVTVRQRDEIAGVCGRTSLVSERSPQEPVFPTLARTAPG